MRGWIRFTLGREFLAAQQVVVVNAGAFQIIVTIAVFRSLLCAWVMGSQ
jgi:hypothetical protein